MELITRLKNAVKAYDDAHNFTCDLCGRELFANERLCAPCRKALPWNDGCVCPFCGRRGSWCGSSAAKNTSTA